MRISFLKLFLLITSFVFSILLPLSLSAQLSAPNGSVAAVSNGTSNVGIGTLTPVSTLMLTSNTSEATSLTIQHGVGSRFWISHNSVDNILKIGGAGTSLPDLGAINIKWGNVGIGTEPLSGKKMVVNGSMGVITSGYADFSLEQTDSNSKIALGITSNSQEAFISSKGELKFLTNLSATPKMFITKEGNIGIGTKVPQTNLHVVGVARFMRAGGGSNYLDISSDSNGSFIESNDGGVNQKHLYFRVAPTGDNMMDRHMFFQAGKSSGTYQTRMMIHGNGNVGIGTTSPDAKLTVKGDIHAQEVKIDLTGALTPPDYVFEESYSLMSLEETEKYIQTNKHLPEVPSAKEMEQNGVKLLEMNMLLLKKVEELTLHVIGQQKEIETLKKMVNELNEKNQNKN